MTPNSNAPGSGWPFRHIDRETIVIPPEAHPRRWHVWAGVALTGALLVGKALLLAFGAWEIRMPHQ
jgi:hypothetical protein